MGCSKRTSHCRQRTSQLVPMIGGVYETSNAKPLPAVRESELRPCTSVNTATREPARRPVLNQVKTETLARLAARKADGIAWFE